MLYKNVKYGREIYLRLIRIFRYLYKANLKYLMDFL